MMTARIRIDALSSSWPIPSAAAVMAPANAATTQAPSTPTARPDPTHRPRPRTPYVAATMMLTTSAASSVSRKTMIAVASMTPLLTNPVLLLRDHLALRGLMEIIEERVGAGRQRSDVDGHRLTGRHDLLAVELSALELDRDFAGVCDDQLEFDTSLHIEGSWLKARVVDRQGIGRLLRAPGSPSSHQYRADSDQLD